MTNLGDSSVSSMVCFVTCALIAAGAGAASTWSVGAGLDFEGDETYLVSALETADGGILALGASNVFSANGSSDLWLLKLDRKGEIQWQRACGDYLGEVPVTILSAPGGGYVVGGWTSSFGAGYTDIWLLKLDEQAEIEWQRAYGSPGQERLGAITATADGGYLVAGAFLYDSGADDVLLLKLDGDGDLVWQRIYGTPEAEWAASITETENGEIVLGGRSGEAGQTDALVMLLDPAGDVEWAKAFPPYRTERMTGSVLQSVDGALIATGTSWAEGACGLMDVAWMIRLDLAGNVQWEKKYSTTSNNRIDSAAPAHDGGIVLAGGSATSPIGMRHDVWVTKLDAAGLLEWTWQYGTQRSDFVAPGTAVRPVSDGGFILAGYTQENELLPRENGWLLKIDGKGRTRGCPCGREPEHSSEAVLPVVRDVTLVVSPGNAVVTDTGAESFETELTVRGCAKAIPSCPDWRTSMSKTLGPGVKQK